LLFTPALKGRDTFHAQPDTPNGFVTPFQGWDYYAICFYTWRYPVLGSFALSGLGLSKIRSSPERATYQSDGCSPSHDPKNQPIPALKGRDTFHAQPDTPSGFITPFQGWDYLKSAPSLKGRQTKAMGAAHRMIQKTSQFQP